MIRASRRLGAVLVVLSATIVGCGGDPDAERAQDDLKEVSPLGPEPAGSPARYPIVLAHGFDASPTNRCAWNGVAEALERDGHLVYVAQVPPYDAPEVRAGFLRDFVDQAVADGAEKVNIL